MSDIILTVAEIKDLAEFAGFTLHTRFMPDADEMQSEIAISKCPAEGVVVGEDGARLRYKHVAYFDEYPDEGCCPLGDPD